MRLARGRALVAAGADIIDVGGESARGDRPAVSGRRGDRARRGAGRRAGRATACWCRWTPTRSTVAEAAIAAGAAIVNDVSGLRDPRAGRGVRAHRARRSCSCTPRSSRRGRCSTRRPTTTSWPTSSRSCARGSTVALAAGVAEEQLILDPGPDFAKTPGADRRGAAPAGRAARVRAADPAGRLAQGLRGGDHRARARASAIAGTLAALGYGRRRGRLDPARARRRGRGGLLRGARGAARRARAGRRWKG